jgi:tetratricopeptide (TPR) repeat protein
MMYGSCEAVPSSSTLAERHYQSLLLFERATSHSPPTTEIHHMGVAMSQHLERAVTFKIEGDYDAAVAVLKEILADDPDLSEAHHQLGLVYGFTGEFDESLSELERAVALDGANLTTRLDLAKTYAMLGMYDEAKSGFEYVLSVDPGNEVAKQQLSFF